MSRLIYSLTFFIVIALLACKKDTNRPVETVDPIALLTNKDWKKVNEFLQPNYFIGPDPFSVIPTCKKDDLYRFETNGTFKLIEGITKCNPSDPDTLFGSWSFNSSASYLTFQLPGTQYPSIAGRLTIQYSNYFQLNTTSNFNGMSYDIIRHFAKQ